MRELWRTWQHLQYFYFIDTLTASNSVKYQIYNNIQLLWWSFYSFVTFLLLSWRITAYYLNHWIYMITNHISSFNSLATTLKIVLSPAYLIILSAGQNDLKMTMISVIAIYPSYCDGSRWNDFVFSIEINHVLWWSHQRKYALDLSLSKNTCSAFSSVL